PNAGAVRELLVQIQKLFRVRQCSDSFFANRTRPCLQHQIDRCSAPCVGLVEPADYARDVSDALLFIQGRNEDVLDNLVRRMEEAATALEYERAAKFRDQIALVRRIQGEQVVSGGGAAEADAIAVHGDGRQYCVSLLVVRGGRVLGSRNFFPRAVADTPMEEV